MPEVAARTHVGHVREDNEDAHVVSGSAWVVADGLGGHAGGEVASDLAARAAHEVLDAGGGTVEAYRAAAHAVTGGADGEPSLARMGTTLVSAVRSGDDVVVAGVGDSRVYLLDDDGLRQLTVDDNEAQTLVSAGVITREQARTHPGQFVLTRCFLAGDAEPPVPQPVTLVGRGRLLLCTDGLTGEVDDPVVALLLGSGTVEDAADALVRAALDAGGSDNVTVVVVDL